MSKNVVLTFRKFINESAKKSSNLSGEISNLKFTSPENAVRFYALRKVKGNDTVRSERKALRNNSSWKARVLLWEQKKSQGNQSRHLLLAWSYFRGVPYRSVEISSKPIYLKKVLSVITDVYKEVGEPVPAWYNMTSLELWVQKNQPTQVAAE